MMTVDIFDSISPLDYRYSRTEIVRKLSKYLSENAKVKYQAMVECAAAKVLEKESLCPKAAAEEICAACQKISASEVYEEEEKTKHDIRALANCIRNRVSEAAKPFVHFGLTSYDVVNTADALRYKECAEAVIIPALLELEKTLISIARNEKNTLQIGRTHGQHAEPITFGFALAEYVDRIGNRIIELKKSADGLRGKISGAVGAYNSLSLFFGDPEEFEKEVLNELGLKPALHSKQIVEPEFVLDFLHHIVSCFGILANLSDDMRHLQRSEIAEVSEAFGEAQVGSSTMPHKRNPVSFENVKSLWKSTMPRLMTVYMDQISEHQRDLTNSASSRFIPEILAAFAITIERMNKTMAKLAVDKAGMARNFDKSKDAIIAEPLYLLLAFYSHPDAHEAVRKLSSESNLLELAEKNFPAYFKKFTPKQVDILKNPQKYTGLSEKKTEDVCSSWEKKLGIK
ncbi:MAG: adenylosuccinate lyase [Candidatus Aenigmarchaeota archaeon]|nr:adenylosuccinate lyase [Candidatus Aenigmarchaeota archaeon]